jgi:hypothetical protein
MLSLRFFDLFLKRVLVIELQMDLVWCVASFELCNRSTFFLWICSLM